MPLSVDTPGARQHDARLIRADQFCKHRRLVHGFSFSTEHRVRFAETDAQGIAHNSNYLIWFEVARVAYLERYAGGYQRLREHGVEALVLESHVRYLQPARSTTTRRARTLRRLERRPLPVRVRDRARGRRDRGRLDGACDRRRRDAAPDPRADVAGRGDIAAEPERRSSAAVRTPSSSSTTGGFLASSPSSARRE